MFSVSSELTDLSKYGDWSLTKARQDAPEARLLQASRDASQKGPLRVATLPKSGRPEV